MTNSFGLSKEQEQFYSLMRCPLSGQTHLNLFDKNMKFCVAGKAEKLGENSNIF